MKTIYQDNYRMLIGRLVEVRKGQSLTQLEVAERLQKPQSYIAKIENFERKLDVLEFVQLCKILKVRPSEIIAFME